MTINARFSKLLPILSFIFWFFCLLYCEGFLRSCAVLLSVALHECGHLFAFLILGQNLPRLHFRTLGITLKPIRMLSYRNEAIIAFFGPLFNLLTAFLAAAARPTSAFADTLASVSFLLAGVHLLPMIPLDGGRISFALFHSCFGEKGARFAAALSFGTLCISLFFFLYFLLYYGTGLTPLFSVLLLFREQEKSRFDL